MEVTILIMGVVLFIMYRILTHTKAEPESKIDEAQVNQYLYQFERENTIPYIKLTASPTPHISPMCSKLGGTPYLPPGFVYPTTACGKVLTFLAQLNFEDMPALENFPSAGILQFYILQDHDLGLTSQQFKVVYHPEVIEAAPIPPPPPYQGEGATLPFAGEYLLTGAIKDSPMNIYHHRFPHKFAMFCKANNLETLFAPYFKDYYEDDHNQYGFQHNQLANLVTAALSTGGDHALGGHPYFATQDPRHTTALAQYDTLLLQVASEYDEDRDIYQVQWGDCGVANFFINAQDLKNRNFQNILYHWDCHQKGENTHD